MQLHRERENLKKLDIEEVNKSDKYAWSHYFATYTRTTSEAIGILK